jgi:hypothetical protein
MTCEHCNKAKICKGKHLRDEFINAYRYFEVPDGSLRVMECIVANCSEFNECKDESLVNKKKEQS